MPRYAKEIDHDQLIRYVDKKDGPYLLHYGEGFIYDRLPEGTRLVYPPPPLEPITDIDGRIEQALDSPLGCEPLNAMLRPGMKVTIAFDDISLPLPPMQQPDLRQRIITILLRRLAEKGIDDIHLIAANSLHRRMTPAELRRILGHDIFNRFWPHSLYNHDAEDPDGNVHLGFTQLGEDVEINRRAVESDLLLYANITLVSMDGGHKSVPVGLGTYRSLRHHHNVRTLLNCRPYMDPPRSAMHHSCDRMGKVVAAHCNILTIETTVNSDTFPRFLPFLQRQEREWGLSDHINMQVNRIGSATLPRKLNRAIWQAMRAPYRPTSIVAGRTDPVHQATVEAVFRQQCVPVKGQADIVIAGLPYLCPYNVNSIMNPILVMCLGHGYMFNLHRGMPLVREGGVLIFLHKLPWEFHPVHHPSYIEFFERVLPATRAPLEIERRFEAEFATNPKYIDLYRHSHAYHGVHCFYMWYWGCWALQHVAKTIFVRPQSPAAAHRMGFDTAPTIAEAVQMAKDVVGPNPSITCYHWPPIFVCDVSE